MSPDEKQGLNSLKRGDDQEMEMRRKANVVIRVTRNKSVLDK